MTEPHVPIEQLAAFAAGDLDAAAAVTVEAHLVLCADCRADVEAVKATAAALRGVPPVAMPPDVAGRLDAALAAAPRVPPVAANRRSGDVLPMRRRRPSMAGLAAVAAGVALLGALTVPFLTTDKKDSGDATAARENGGVTTRRLSSGLPYARDNLAATLDRALAGVAVTDSAAGPVAAPSPVSPEPTSSRSGLKAGSTKDASRLALESDVGRLAACIDALVGDAPEAGRTPLVVDFGTFQGQPAAVFVFPTVTSSGETRPTRVDVWVVGAGCGQKAGGDVLDFQRIARPDL